MCSVVSSSSVTLTDSIRGNSTRQAQITLLVTATTKLIQWLEIDECTNTGKQLITIYIHV